MLSKEEAVRIVQRTRDDYDNLRRAMDAFWTMGILYDTGKQWGFTTTDHGRNVIHQLRQVIEGAVRVAINEQRNSARDLETSLRVRMESTGTEFVDLTESERDLFVEASAPAIVLAHQNVPEELFDWARS